MLKRLRSFFKNLFGTSGRDASDKADVNTEAFLTPEEAVDDLTPSEDAGEFILPEEVETEIQKEASAKKKKNDSKKPAETNADEEASDGKDSEQKSSNKKKSDKKDSDKKGSDKKDSGKKDSGKKDSDKKGPGKKGSDKKKSAKDKTPSAEEFKNRLYSCYDNRELSWLKFNTRVLEEAEDMRNPLGERLSFISVFQTNLDEFFRVRVGSLYDQMLVSEEIRDNKTNMTCREQISAICQQTRMLTQRRDAAYDDLKDELREHGVEIMELPELDGQDIEFLDAYFENAVYPLLAPQIVGKKQPFPFLNNREIYVVAVLEKKDKESLGIIPCSTDVLPRLIRIPAHKNRYVLLEDLILRYADNVFDQYTVLSKSQIRILRNADIDPDEDMYDDDADFRKIMEQLVSRRSRLAPIKLEYTGALDEAVFSRMCDQLKIKKKYVFHCNSPQDLSFFAEIRDLLRGEKDLFFEKVSPQIPEDIDPKKSILDQIREKDRFLFFPYDSMDPFLKMLMEAADNPDVVSVKVTLYRMAPHSKVVEALMRAAEQGKEVDVLVELRARFDEENNIDWSRRLEEAGCRILYGLDNLKVHSKICLVTTRREGHIYYYTQIGTGNYNEDTALQYTDFSLLTANQEIGADVSDVFTKLYLGEVVDESRYLLVAPKCFSLPIQEKIDAQIALAREGKPAYIGAKMNSLTDKPLIEKLIEASMAGVKIELIVRGACCLIAGVPGLTDNIEIRSIVGRYLEHSRFYIFGAADPEVYLSSADFMTRNTTHRVEVAAPVFDEEIKAQLLRIFDTLMKGNVKARTQLADGRYVHVVTGANAISAQSRFWSQKYR